MGTRIFVRNVHPAVTEAELKSFASQAGRVISVRIPLDRETEKPRGFAFVEFSDADEAEAAIGSLSGALLKGRPVRVEEATERERPRGSTRPLDPQLGEDERAGPRRRHEIEDVDYSRAPRDKAARHGKHASDRKSVRGTRRTID